VCGTLAAGVAAVILRIINLLTVVIDLLLQGGEIPFDLKVGRYQGVDTKRIPPEAKKALDQVPANITGWREAMDYGQTVNAKF
jgi:hypothetical protein